MFWEDGNAIATSQSNFLKRMHRLQSVRASLLAPDASVDVTGASNGLVLTRVGRSHRRELSDEAFHHSRPPIWADMSVGTRSWAE